MLNIKRALKAKISDYSEESFKKSNDKCLLARNFLNSAYSSENPSQYLIKALDTYIEAIEIYSRLIEPYLAIAEICRQFEQTEDSIALLNKVLDIEPKHPVATKMLENMNFGNITLNTEKKELKRISRPVSIISKDKKDIDNICSVKFGIPLK